MLGSPSFRRNEGVDSTDEILKREDRAHDSPPICCDCKRGTNATEYRHALLTVMRFSYAPQERGGYPNKGNNHVFSNVDEPAVQHGQRPVGKWRQRQLQTLVSPLSVRCPAPQV